MPTPGTVEYPAALDTIQSLCGEIKNNASTTLTSSITDSALSIPVSAASEFPDSGFVTITDSLTIPTIFEIVIYTSKSGSNLIVPPGGRGAQGTAAAAFSAGAAVEQRPTAALWTALRDAIIELEEKLGIGADTPSAGQVLYCDSNGSTSWQSGVARVVHESRTQTGTVTTGLDTLRSTNISGLLADGDFAEFLYIGSLASNDNQKRLQLTIGAAAALENSGLIDIDQGWFRVAGTVTRLSDTSVLAEVDMSFGFLNQIDGAAAQSGSSLRRIARNATLTSLADLDSNPLNFLLEAETDGVSGGGTDDIILKLSRIKLTRMS